jgi:hypothetical protein
MKNIKLYLPWTIKILISLLFIISAVAKLYPSPYFAISTFEVKQLYPMGFSEELSVYFSRILIGIEFALGILILQKHFLKTIVIPATLLMLGVFTTHLIIQSFIYGGNEGNCGCFGSLLPMTPIEAIIKNVIAMILLGILFYFLPKKSESNNNFWILSTTTLGFILILFMLAPIQPQSALNLEPEVAKEPSNATENETIIPENVPERIIIKDSIKKEIVKIVDEPTKHKSGYDQYFAKIDSGKKTLCFFVPGCEHCRVAAKELTEMKLRNKNSPEINIIFMNEEANLIPDFFKFAGATYPYKIIEIIPFWKTLGTGKDTPGIKYLWNGNEYIYYYGITDNQFNLSNYEKLVDKTFSELKTK